MGTQSRKSVMAMVSLLITGAASAAWGNTVWIEAESARDPFRGGITSPMMIRDDSSASGGGFIEVAGGNNLTNNTTPGSEGVAKFNFSVGNAGTYKAWARVKAPTDSDDSFWVRMGTWMPAAEGEADGHFAYGNWIKWNGIPLGSGWHWVQIKAEGASAEPPFALSGDHQIQIGYREDGTKLDALVLTDTGFDPTAAVTGRPALPIIQPVVSSRTALKVSWSTVPGATSYTLERRDDGCCPYLPWQVIATGLTGHKYVDAVPLNTFRTYRVTAVGPTGTSVHDPDPMGWDVSMDSGYTGNFYLRTQSHFLSVTPAMVTNEWGSVGAPAGMESLSAPPAHGRARFDFEVAASAKVRLWAITAAPNKDQDSFWVRLDDGPWIKWNNIANGGCDDVHDSDNGDRGVQYSLSAGSHRYEFAYREGGAALTNIVTMLEGVDAGGDVCSD
jgi:hypothetical protein